MPIRFVRADITRMRVDAIVNAANYTLLGGGGVDGAIHAAAGPGLLEECRLLGGCRVGQAKLTGGHRLPAKYIIHTVGPWWRGGSCGEAALLADCYRSSLQLAVENGCATVAFPLISAGAYGYPRIEALRIATDTVRDFLAQHDLLVYIVVYDADSFQISAELVRDITAYIDDSYVQAHAQPALRELAAEHILRRQALAADSAENAVQADAAPTLAAAPAPMAAPKLQPQANSADEARLSAPKKKKSGLADLWEGFGAQRDAALEELVGRLDESFYQMLLRKIDEKQMTDAQCYKRANIDRKLFSKIRSDIHYRPSKATAIAFAIALQLPLAETGELLGKAGFALSHSSKFDIIIEYFITRGEYDVLRINEALFAFDQPLLGG